MSRIGVAKQEVMDTFNLDDADLYDVCEWLGIEVGELTDDEQELADMGVE